MKTYASAEAFFAAVKTLIAQLEHAGFDEAAREIRAGFNSLNGLTDGWALFMESLEKVAAEHGPWLPGGLRAELHAMLAAVRKTVYRNYPNRLLHRFRNLLFPR